MKTPSSHLYSLGVYAVPAFGNEWYPRRMYLQENEREVFQHHLKTYGPQSKFGYKDFIPRSKPRSTTQRVGHLFKTQARGSSCRWRAPRRLPSVRLLVHRLERRQDGPKRDVVGDLANAVRKQGMRFGASSHRAEHWWFFDGGMKFDSDVKDPRYAGCTALHSPAPAGAKSDNQPNRDYLNDWLARTSELVDKYKPELLWFDWWIEEPVFEPYLQRFASFYYNRGAEWKHGGVAINYKNKAFPEKTAVLDIERGKLDAIRPMVWQTDTSIGLRSWGYIENEEFRSADSL